MSKENLEYAGFWIRVGAGLIDTVMLMLIVAPVMYAVYGEDYFYSDQTVLGLADVLMNWIFPFVATVLFWLSGGATPGKMATKLKVVDERTGNNISTKQAIIRYIGYFISAFCFLLGLIWVAIHSKKRGWHDMLAGTVVIRTRGKEPVVFEQ